VDVELSRPDTQAIRRRWQVESHQAAQGSALQASGCRGSSSVYYVRPITSSPASAR
jgi:hypothetical protein